VYVRVPALRISGLGTHGAHAQNVERDLHRWLVNLHNLRLQPYFIQMELFDYKSCTVVLKDVPIVAPHELFSAMFHKGPNVFQRCMLGECPPSVVGEFWENAMMQPWGPVHPAARDPSVLDETYPLVFHYDGAEAYTNAEAHIWSMSSLFTTGNALDCKFIVCLLMNNLIPTPELQHKAHTSICNFIAWSLEHGLHGRGPLTGYLGEQFIRFSYRESLAGKWLADGRRCCFGGLKADRKAVASLHGYSRNYLSTFMCEGCFAVRTFKHAPKSFNFASFFPTAPWRSTVLSHASFMCLDGWKSPWAKVPGWHLQLNFEDLMHNTLLGHAGDAICSIVASWFDDGLLGGASDEIRMETLGVEFRLWCMANTLKCPSGLFGLSIFGLEKRGLYPTMHTRVKAAHVRILLSFIASKAVEVCSGSSESKIRTTMIWALADFFHCLDHGSRWLTYEEQQRALQSGRLYLQTYQHLASDYLRRRIPNYKIRPKAHYFDHQILTQIEASGLNPRHVHCFGDEDFMGCVTKIAKRTSSQTTSLRTLQRWLLFVGQRWDQFACSDSWTM
jgi:hypothetical protein